jgi:hypothetical protein
VSFMWFHGRNSSSQYGSTIQGFVTDKWNRCRRLPSERRFPPLLTRLSTNPQLE